jgi:hypothetical protein
MEGVHDSSIAEKVAGEGFQRRHRRMEGRENLHGNRMKISPYTAALLSGTSNE